MNWTPPYGVWKILFVLLCNVLYQSAALGLDNGLQSSYWLRGSLVKYSTKNYEFWFKSTFILELEPVKTNSKIFLLFYNWAFGQNNN